MRGYEILYVRSVFFLPNVIYPHEGLWGRSLRKVGVGFRRLSIPMRGYERFSMIRGCPRCCRYLSPWGVMREHSRRVELLYAGYLSPWGVMSLWCEFWVYWVCRLSIPMRGYEGIYPVTVSATDPVIYPHEGLWVRKKSGGIYGKNVIYPHEGLWVDAGIAAVSAPVRYLSPWGVMRERLGSVVLRRFLVIYPHEGLWAARLLPCPVRQRVIYPHEGLWVTLTRRSQDHNGVIYPHEGLWDLLSFMLWIIPACYLSPWGVMRLRAENFLEFRDVLSIPMRGYEKHNANVKGAINSVIYPHEGLWAKPASRLPKSCLSYLSPWGVMRIASPVSISHKSRVIYPHEGLWGAKIPDYPAEYFSYLSPWGVMSCKRHGRCLCMISVIYPHEGLWAQ